MDFRFLVGCSEKKGFGYLCESNTKKMKHLQIFHLIYFQQKEEKLGSTPPSNIQHICSLMKTSYLTSNVCAVLRVGSKTGMVKIVSNLCQHLQAKKINLSQENYFRLYLENLKKKKIFFFIICICCFAYMQPGYSGKFLNHLQVVQKARLARKFTFSSLFPCCQHKHNS